VFVKNTSEEIISILDGGEQISRWTYGPRRWGLGEKRIPFVRRR